MFVSKYLTAIAVVVSAATLSVRADLAPPEFRALWADAWHEGFQSQAEVNDLVANARATKCNAVFVQARNRGGAYCQASAFEPVSRTVATGFDPLGRVIRAARGAKSSSKVEVHTW